MAESFQVVLLCISMWLLLHMLAKLLGAEEHVMAFVQSVPTRVSSYTSD